MNRTLRPKALMAMAVVAALTGWAWGQATQPTVTPDTAGVDGRVGTVKGDNVYVRSGSDSNYYPVVKLNKGDKVTVVGSEQGWLKIAPPPGTFSLVDKAFVEKAGEGSGTLNGQTWAIAGSQLDKRHYAKQVRLEKGTTVQILGETEDGAYYKVPPPAGAHLWISADFVDAGAGAARSSIEPVKPGDLNLDGGGQPAKARPQTSTEPRKTAPRPSETRPATESLPPAYASRIRAVEAEVSAEMTKPVADRKFDSVLDKLQDIIDEGGDPITEAYAKARIVQIRDQIELGSTVNTIRKLREDAMRRAAEIAKQRSSIRPGGPFNTDDVVARGEIRASSVYQGERSRPKRWRLVNPENGRIICYIEVPTGSPIDPVQFYGKAVAIRASSYQLMSGAVPPVPIYTVREIEVIDPETLESFKPVPPVHMGMEASGRGPVAAPPASRPAGRERPASRPAGE